MEPILCCCARPSLGRGCKRVAEALTEAVGPHMRVGSRPRQLPLTSAAPPTPGGPKLPETTWNHHLRRCRCCSAGHRSSLVGASIRSDAAAPHGSSDAHRATYCTDGGCGLSPCDTSFVLLRPILGYILTAVVYIVLRIDAWTAPGGTSINHCSLESGERPKFET